MPRTEPADRRTPQKVFRSHRRSPAAPRRYVLPSPQDTVPDCATTTLLQCPSHRIEPHTYTGYRCAKPRRRVAQAPGDIRVAGTLFRPESGNVAQGELCWSCAWGPACWTRRGETRTLTGLPAYYLGQLFLPYPRIGSVYSCEIATTCLLLPIISISWYSCETITSTFLLTFPCSA